MVPLARTCYNGDARQGALNLTPFPRKKATQQGVSFYEKPTNRQADLAHSRVSRMG